MAAVLVGVVHLDSWAALSIVPDAYSVSCASGQSSGLIVGVCCLLRSSAVPSVRSFHRLTQPGTTVVSPAVCTRQPPPASAPASLRPPVWSSVRSSLLRLQTSHVFAPARLPAHAPVTRMSTPVRRSLPLGRCGRRPPVSGGYVRFGFWFFGVLCYCLYCSFGCGCFMDSQYRVSHSTRPGNMTARVNSVSAPLGLVTSSTPPSRMSTPDLHHEGVNPEAAPQLNVVSLRHAARELRTACFRTPSGRSFRNESQSRSTALWHHRSVAAASSRGRPQTRNTSPAKTHQRAFVFLGGARRLEFSPCNIST